MVTKSTLLLVGLGDFNISLETFNRLGHNSRFKYALLRKMLCGFSNIVLRLCLYTEPWIT